MYFCAWCHRRIKRAAGNLRGQRTVKHGICRKCLEQQLARLTALPAPAAARLPESTAHAA